MAMGDVEQSRNITSTAYGPFKLPQETKTWKGHGENTPTATPATATAPVMRGRARHVTEHVEAAAEHA